MTKSSRFFDEYRAQTRLKHFVLESYLDRWAPILLQERRHLRAWFIDAFAGPGRDKEGNPGSPILACESAHRLRERLIAKGLNPLPRLEVVAIEKSPSRYADLCREVERFATGDDPCIKTYLGTLENHFTEIWNAGNPTDPRLFFLDPFGVKGLSADLIRTILSREKQEVLLLFSDAGALRLDGAARSVPTKRKKTESLPDLFSAPMTESMPAPELEKDTDVSWAATGPAAEAILRIAFGENYDAACASVRSAPGREQRRAWLRAYVTALRSWGASQIVPFSVIDERERHQYYLVHAATHPKATEAMKDAIRAAVSQREAQRGSNQQASMFYQTTVDPRIVLDETARHFAGKTVRWQDRKSPGTISKFLITTTDCLYSDLPAVQAELNSRGWRHPDQRAATYTFPPLR